MVSTLNVPDVGFPIRFRQRVEGRLMEFRLAKNPESGRVQLSLFKGGDVVFWDHPIYTLNPTGLSYPELDVFVYAATEDLVERKVTEERVREGTVMLRVREKNGSE